MPEPTKAQVKEFWEWCGFQTKIVDKVEGYGDQDGEYTCVFDPNDREIGYYPPIDLNNLFKYPPQRMTAALWRKIIREWAAFLTGDYREDTLALFWALWQVKEKIGGGRR